MFPFNKMMSSFSPFAKNNVMGFNPFELHTQMMQHHPMMKQNPMMQQNPMQHFPMMNQKPKASIFNSFPFNYENQQYQEENPFLNSFFQPQSPIQQQQPNPRAQQQPFFHQQPGVYPQQNFMNQPQGQYNAPPQFPQSLFRDQNGKIDLNKIGGGVQTALSLANQVSPVMKMLGGFFK